MYGVGCYKNPEEGNRTEKRERLADTGANHQRDRVLSEGTHLNEAHGRHLFGTEV